MFALTVKLKFIILRPKSSSTGLKWPKPWKGPTLHDVSGLHRPPPYYTAPLGKNCVGKQLPPRGGVNGGVYALLLTPVPITKLLGLYF